MINSCPVIQYYLEDRIFIKEFEKELYCWEQLSLPPQLDTYIYSISSFKKH